MFNPRTAQELRNTGTMWVYTAVFVYRQSRQFECFSLLCTRETKSTDERKALANACFPTHQRSRPISKGAGHTQSSVPRQWTQNRQDISYAQQLPFNSLFQ